MRDTETPVRVRLAARLPEMLLRGETCDRLDVPFVTKNKLSQPKIRAAFCSDFATGPV